VEARFNQARAHAGDGIGSLAAQSLGEPTTQVGQITVTSKFFPANFLNGGSSEGKQRKSERDHTARKLPAAST